MRLKTGRSFIYLFYFCNCRDVLTIGKRLARERDEMCRELRRLHESTLELHDKMIMEMQTTTTKRGIDPRNMQQHQQQDRNQDNILQACNALHERWQQNSRQWFSQSSEAEQHKLWIAEESWRQVKTSTGSSGPSSLQDQTYHQRHLRDRCVHFTHFINNSAYLLRYMYIV